MARDLPQGQRPARSTKVLYAGLTRAYVEPVIGAVRCGAVRLERLKPADVTRVLLAMEEAGKASSTRRNTYAALRGALDDAVRNGLLASNPVMQVKRPRNDVREAPVLTPEQVTRFLAGAEGLRYVVRSQAQGGAALAR